MRRSPKFSEVLPAWYVRGLFSGDFQEAPDALPGDRAPGLSASSAARMMSSWEQEYRSFRHLNPSDRDYVYVWADGIHFWGRLEDDRLCTLGPAWRAP